MFFDATGFREDYERKGLEVVRGYGVETAVTLYVESSFRMLERK